MSSTVIFVGLPEGSKSSVTKYVEFVVNIRTYVMTRTYTRWSYDV